MKTLLLLPVLLFGALQVQAQCFDLKPMYGEKCVKSATQARADNQFITAQVKKYGSEDSAARVMLRSSWQAFRNRQPETAMRDLNQAWLLNKQLPDIYFLFGHLTRYTLTRNAAEADKYYELGRLRDPKKDAEPRSLVQLLTILQEQQNLSSAIDASTQLVVGFPNYRNGYGYKQRAYLLTQSQLFDRALEDAEMALKLDPKDPDVFVARGFARSWKGNQEAALDDYNKALALKPASANAYRHRAMLYTDKLQKQDLALADIERAIKLNPQEWHNFKVKSDILFALNRKAEACASLKNATRSGQKSIQDEFKSKCSQ